MNTFKKIWNIVTSVIVALVVLIALALAGTRIVGLGAFTVLSPSMEPTYHVGSLIYVKMFNYEKGDYKSLQVGDPITFVIDDHNKTATHRIIEIIPDEEDPEILRFRTKGDNNEAEDGGAVHCKNVVGKPVFTIPYLGYVANYVQNPPGRYVSIAAVAVLIMLIFIPDLFADDGKKKEKHPNKG